MKALRLNLAVLILLICLTAFGQEKQKIVKPYIIHDRTTLISRADIRKDVRGTENIIQIDVTNASGGTSLVSKSTPMPPAEITDLTLVNGSYNMTRQLSKTGRGMSLQLMDVVFPCRVRATISGQMIDFEIKEVGFWKVSLGLTQ